MNRVKLLCAMDRVMMEAFSQRTVESLKTYGLFRLALPAFQSFLDINLDKEVDKDRIIIAQAAGAQQSGASPSPDHVNTLLQQAREIDQVFIRKATVFPVNIKIRYQDIEYFRQQRIELLLQESYRILVQWQDVRSFRAVVNELYSEAQFHELLHNILGLYAMETRMLSNSVRLPRLLMPARGNVTQTITSVMEQVAEALAGSLTRRVYRHRNKT